MDNKRGQELSVATLILIVLGIILLVLLVLGFSIGWDNLFRKIGIFQGSDISSVVTACNVAVSSNSQASYCEFKKVEIDGEDQYINCEDGRVSGQLKSKLTSCEEASKGTGYKDYCMQLQKKGLTKTVKINGNDCLQSG